VTLVRGSPPEQRNRAAERCCYHYHYLLVTTVDDVLNKKACSASLQRLWVTPRKAEGTSCWVSLSRLCCSCRDVFAVVGKNDELGITGMSVKPRVWLAYVHPTPVHHRLAFRLPMKHQVVMLQRSQKDTKASFNVVAHYRTLAWPTTFVLSIRCPSGAPAAWLFRRHYPAFNLPSDRTPHRRSGRRGPPPGSDPLGQRIPHGRRRPVLAVHYIPNCYRLISLSRLIK